MLISSNRGGKLELCSRTLRHKFVQFGQVFVSLLRLAFHAPPRRWQRIFISPSHREPMQVRHIKVEMQSTVVTGCVGRSWRTVAQTGRCFVKQTLLLFGRHFHIAALRAGDGSLESNQSLLLRFPLFGRRPGVGQRTQVPSRMRLRLTKIKTLTGHL